MGFRGGFRWGWGGGGCPPRVGVVCGGEGDGGGGSGVDSGAGGAACAWAVRVEARCFYFPSRSSAPCFCPSRNLPVCLRERVRDPEGGREMEGEMEREREREGERERERERDRNVAASRRDVPCDQCRGYCSSSALQQKKGLERKKSRGYCSGNAAINGGLQLDAAIIEGLLQRYGLQRWRGLLQPYRLQ